MAELIVNKYERAMQMDLESIVRFQVLVHCHFNDIRLTPHSIATLVYIGCNEGIGLKKLTEDLSATGTFKCAQGVRNMMDTLDQQQLIIREGKYRKTVYLHPDMKIQNRGNIYVDIKCLYREA